MTGPYDTHAKKIRQKEENQFKFAPSMTNNEQQNSLRMFVAAALFGKRVIKARQTGTQESEREKKSVYQEIFQRKRLEKAKEKEAASTKHKSKFGRVGHLGDDPGAPLARQILDETD